MVVEFTQVCVYSLCSGCVIISKRIIKKITLYKTIWFCHYSYKTNISYSGKKICIFLKRRTWFFLETKLFIKYIGEALHTDKQTSQWRGQKSLFLILNVHCIISRPGWSQGLLYKHLCYSFIHSLIDSFIHPLVPTVLHCRHAQMVRDRSSSYKIDYVIGIKNSLSPEGYQNRISGSKVTAILLKGWILPIGGATAGECLRLPPA